MCVTMAGEDVVGRIGKRHKEVFTEQMKKEKSLLIHELLFVFNLLSFLFIFYFFYCFEKFIFG